MTVVLAAAAVERAAALLRAGELVAFPTDTVYGVGAVAWNAGAVARLYVAKLRPLDKAIPVLLADPGDLEMVVENPSRDALRLAERFWPGPLTLVVRRRPELPDAVTSGESTVAVRIPAHDLARALIRAAGAPLATTSANLSGGPSPAEAGEVMRQLAGRVAAVLDGGRCPGGLPSTIVDVTGTHPRLLRAGPLSMAEITAALV